MTKQNSVQDVVEEMFQSVLATPKRERRLLSKTFWNSFGFKARTNAMPGLRDRIQAKAEQNDGGRVVERMPTGGSLCCVPFCMINLN